jgi:hypothetical protein
LLFAEPGPAPIAYWLWRSGLIDSPELRLPMTEASGALAARLDGEIERKFAAPARVAWRLSRSLPTTAACRLQSVAFPATVSHARNR